MTDEARIRDLGCRHKDKHEIFQSSIVILNFSLFLSHSFCASSCMGFCTD